MRERGPHRRESRRRHARFAPALPGPSVSAAVHPALEMPNRSDYGVDAVSCLTLVNIRSCSKGNMAKKQIKSVFPSVPGGQSGAAHGIEG